MSKRERRPKEYLFFCNDCLQPQKEEYKDVMVNVNRVPCLQCGGTLSPRRLHPRADELPEGYVEAPSKATRKAAQLKEPFDESKIIRCYMICVECRTKFTSHDPPERIGNRMQCSFCEGKIVLEHQLEEYLSEQA